MTDILTTQENGVLRLTLNRPERLNSVTTESLNELAELIETARDVRVAVITGEGKGFCSGATLAGDTALAVETPIMMAADRVITAITHSPFPIVAAVNGAAAGIGCSIAVASDLAIAKESSYFLQAFINIGLMPDGGANELLTASIGRARAMKLLLGGERLPAVEAAEIGLIAEAVADERFEETVEAWVSKFASGPSRAYEMTKATVNAAALPTLAETLRREALGQIGLGSTKDFAEGVTAFVEKRPANFTGA